MPLKPGIRIFGRFVLFFAYVGILAWLSLASYPPKVSVKWFSWDKLQHAGAYFFLVFFTGRALLGLIASRQKAWRAAFVFSVFFGILMEMAQGLFSSVRTADGYDIAANISGALILYLLACYFPQISGKPLHPEDSSSRSGAGYTEFS